MADDDMLLSNDDLDALFSGSAGGPEQEAPAAAEAAEAQAAAEPDLLGAGDGGDDGLDAMQLDQAAIDALFSGGMPSAPPAKPKLAPRPAAGEARSGPPREAPAAAAAAGGLGRGPARGRAEQVGDLDLLAEVVMTLSAEIGRTDMTINDVLRLRPGSIVELDKLAGEPVELYVNDCCIARGEVVVVDDSFGIRITELGEG